MPFFLYFTNKQNMMERLYVLTFVLVLMLNGSKDFTTENLN